MERVELRTVPREDESAEVDLTAIDRAWAMGEALTAELELAIKRAPNRHALFSQLLSKLEDPRFGRDLANGRTLRSAYVEAVLLGGYPWALQLEPADVAELPRPRRFEPRRALGAALIAFLVGLGLALLMVPAKVAPAPPSRIERPAPPVIPAERLSTVDAPARRFGPSLEPLRSRVSTISLHDVDEAVKTTAETMRDLIADGHADRAIVLGEACVLSFQATRECMVMLASAHEHAESRNVSLAMQWYSLSQRQDVLERTREARTLVRSALAKNWLVVQREADGPTLLRRLGALAKTPCPSGPSCDPLSTYFLP